MYVYRYNKIHVCVHASALKVSPIDANPHAAECAASAAFWAPSLSRFAALRRRPRPQGLAFSWGGGGVASRGQVNKRLFGRCRGGYKDLNPKP